MWNNVNFPLITVECYIQHTHPFFGMTQTLLFLSFALFIFLSFDLIYLLLIYLLKGNAAMINQKKDARPYFFWCDNNPGHQGSLYSAQMGTDMTCKKVPIKVLGCFYTKKRMGQSMPCPSSFWYDTDFWYFLIVGVIHIILIPILLWYNTDSGHEGSLYSGQNAFYFWIFFFNKTSFVLTMAQDLRIEDTLLQIWWENDTLPVLSLNTP